MAARLTRLLVGLGLLLGAALPSAAAAVVRLPTLQERATSPVPARGADPVYARSYFGARYYRADIGRFTTVDPVYTWQENLADPQRWNRYAYVRNNPLRWTDPDGRCIDDGDGQDCGPKLTKSQVAGIVYNETGSLRETKGGPSLATLYTDLTWALFNGQGLRLAPSHAPSTVSAEVEKSAAFRGLATAVSAACDACVGGGVDPVLGADLFNNRRSDSTKDRRFFNGAGVVTGTVPIVTTVGPYSDSAQKGTKTWETFSRQRDIVLTPPPKKKDPQKERRDNER
jgi:RHS repeat-associated protein